MVRGGLGPSGLSIFTHAHVNYTVIATLYFPTHEYNAVNNTHISVWVVACDAHPDKTALVDWV